MTAVATEATLLDAVPKALFIAGDWLSTPEIVSNAAAPFGAVTHSGFGRKGRGEGIEEYLETKYVAIAR